MKLLLLMSASGSLMVVFYFLFKVFVKGKVSEHSFLPDTGSGSKNPMEEYIL